MVRSIYLLYSLSHRRDFHSLRGLFFIPTSLALFTSLFILFYISSTSNLFIHPGQSHLQLKQSFLSSTLSPPLKSISQILPSSPTKNSFSASLKTVELDETLLVREKNCGMNDSQPTMKVRTGSPGNHVDIKEVFHDRYSFMEKYKEMNRSLKIFVYPHKQDDPFANALLPVDFEPQGNYASESFFKKVLMNSHFITKDPSKADLFYLPFSIARLRHDPRVGIDGIQDFIRDYFFNISQKYPYWNESGGADHFYVACHSVGRSAMGKATEIKSNAIQVVCSSSYYLSAYISHKDASLPQIWPRRGDSPNIESSKRKKLAFFAGSINSPVREKLIEVWRNDSEISVYFGHLNTSYAKELLESKFCLHVKGFEVNTARIGDALYYGCVPVIIANHYDLPFADILDWKSFSIVVATLDIPLLKKILQGISGDEYSILQSNVFKVREHFQWHVSPVDYDAFYMIMYELWLRRSSVRIPLNSYAGSS